MTSKPRVQIKGTRMPPPEAVANGLNQCRQAQGQLEDAINGVTKAEQQLRENAREVRAELQSCVSRQQEALRCREVWLLGQIELLEQLKAETMQQQLHQLHRLRGQFDLMAHQLQNSNSSHDLNNQLSSCMDKLSSLSLTPEETPEMSFLADTRSLRQAITSFGSITAQLVEGVASQVPAPQRGQSCPIAAKKQKTQDGALGDWLLGTRPTSNAPAGFKFSENPQDWLMPQKESKTSCPVLAKVDFLQAWGQIRDLEAWLLQDQAPVSRERTSSSCSSSFSIEKIDESEFLVSSEEEVEGELSDWLITPSVATETASDAERSRWVLKPFEGGWSSSDWLAGASRPAAECSSCCKTAAAVEIENLGRLKCLKTPPDSGPASPSPAVAPPTLEAWLQQAVPAQQTCRANELCSTYSDCVCEENCSKEALSLWLLQQDGRDKNGVAVAKKATPTTKTAPPIIKTAPPTLYHKEQEQKVQAILQAWLHPANTTSSSSSSSCRSPAGLSLSGWVAPGEEKASREDHSSCFKPPSSSMFERPLDTDLWLLPQKTPAPGSGGRPRPSEEEDKWLLKKRSQAQERLALPTVCDLFSCMKVGGDKEQWLHSAPLQM